MLFLCIKQKHFGHSEKEYDRQQHAERLANLNAKQETFKALIAHSTDQLVFIGEHVLRKSFIHELCKVQYDNFNGTVIHYFDFELKPYMDSMTTAIRIPESEMPFSEIIELLKK